MDKIIFADFDGTITKKDTCDTMTEVFARDGWKELLKLWEEKKLSTEQCVNMIFDLYDANLEDVKKLLDTIEIDDYFKRFISYCRGKGYRIYILSDGYDFNIETIFKKYDIDLPYFANHVTYGSKFRIECPNRSSSCSICGTCKLELMKKLKSDDEQAVYIGDGYSDTCPAMNADIVFAKNVLYKVCTEKGIDAVPYASFRDIMDSGLI